MIFLKKYLHIILKLVLYVSITVWITNCVANNKNLYEKGKQHFLLAEYHSSYKELYPLAQKGEPKAQYAIGYMQYYGLGTLRNQTVGMQWMLRAAAQGDPLAKQAIQFIRDNN